MQSASVVEQHEVALLPVLRIHILRCNSRSLDVIADLSHLLQIIDYSPVLEMQLAHR